jgi:hypothetical protein
MPATGNGGGKTKTKILVPLQFRYRQLSLHNDIAALTTSPMYFSAHNSMRKQNMETCLIL